MIILVQGLQHPLVERFAMCHHGQVFHLVGHTEPHSRKQVSVLCVFLLDSMYLGREKVVVIRNGLNKTVEFINNFIVTNDNNTNAACTRHLTIGRLKVNGRKVIQMILRYIRRPFLV